MVYRKVAFFVYRSQLKLVWRHLVVSRLAGYSQFEGTYFEVFHERLHPVRYRSEVVVVHLLVLSAFVAHQRPACKHQVGACRVQSLVYEKVLLFPSQVAANAFHLGVEIPANICRRHIDRVQRPEQRRLVVERLACI